MKEGDVYRWYYKDDEEYRKRNPSTAYWCMDNQCVVKDGKLYDTYWCYNLDTFGSSCREVNPEDVDLTFICNLHDINFIHYTDVDEYEKVYNLSYHKQHKRLFAVDKGVTKSNNAIKAKLVKEIKKAEHEISYLQHTIQWNREKIDTLGE